MHLRAELCKQKQPVNAENIVYRCYLRWTFADAYRTGERVEDVIEQAFEEGGLQKLALAMARMYELRGLLAA